MIYTVFQKQTGFNKWLSNVKNSKLMKKLRKYILIINIKLYIKVIIKEDNKVIILIKIIYN